MTAARRFIFIAVFFVFLVDVERISGKVSLILEKAVPVERSH